jgi:hypothetical protein
MKAVVCGLLLFAQALMSHAQDATWQLKNEFEIAVLDGESTGFKTPDGDPLVSISFDPAQYKQETFSPEELRVGKKRSAGRMLPRFRSDDRAPFRPAG